jgi:hypothetical protein
MTSALPCQDHATVLAEVKAKPCDGCGRRLTAWGESRPKLKIH